MIGFHCSWHEWGLLVTIFGGVKCWLRCMQSQKGAFFSVGLNILSLSWGWYCLIVTCYIFAWGVFPLLRSVCARVRVYVLLVVTCTVDVVPSHPVSQLFFKPLLTFMNNGSIGLLYFEKTATVSQLMIYTSQSKMLYYL